MLEIIDWGNISYLEAQDRQLKLVEKVALGHQPDTILFCSHSPVVTLGRSTKPQDIFAWEGEVVEVSRGGRATYHGPSQVIIYPILNLRHRRCGMRPKDLHQYMRLLEKVTKEALEAMGVEVQAKNHKVLGEEDPDVSATGLWFKNRKLASIGIAVRKWVTYHGLALNFYRDEQAFVGLNPCGFHSSTMISLEEIAGRKPEREEFIENLKVTLGRDLEIVS